MNVLIVENDATAAESAKLHLEKHGHSVHKVSSGLAALKFHHAANLILTELDLHDIDGIELCRRIRATSNAPIIVITNRMTELDRVLGYSSGIDDYIGKPYGLIELMARINALMRRVHPIRADKTPIDCGDLRIDPTARLVQVAKKQVDLTRKEFDLLQLLASHSNEVVSRENILQSVWGHKPVAPVSTRTVDTHINSLRRKLGRKSWIATVRGVGFRFSATAE
ncbi:response regulator transcription factor [Amycolatopsis sp. NPDC059090]|uniref:response regulator transcription factor n=1 Tax=unclassified Amycolatopsis TaxID=2618356 RepID=UPI00366D017B